MAAPAGQRARTHAGPAQPRGIVADEPRRGGRQPGVRGQRGRAGAAHVREQAAQEGARARAVGRGVRARAARPQRARLHLRRRQPARRRGRRRSRGGAPGAHVTRARAGGAPTHCHDERQLSPTFRAPAWDAGCASQPRGHRMLTGRWPPARCVPGPCRPGRMRRRPGRRPAAAHRQVSVPPRIPAASSSLSAEPPGRAYQHSTRRWLRRRQRSAPDGIALLPCKRPRLPHPAPARPSAARTAGRSARPQWPARRRPPAAQRRRAPGSRRAAPRTRRPAPPRRPAACAACRG
jgi:hypothetical protein